MYDYTCMIPRDFFVANMDSSFLRHGTSKESQATPLHLRTRTASVRQCLANSKINKHQIDLQNVDLSNWPFIIDHQINKNMVHDVLLEKREVQVLGGKKHYSPQKKTWDNPACPIVKRTFQRGLSMNILIYYHHRFKGGTYPKCKLHFSRCFLRGPWKCKLTCWRYFADPPHKNDTWGACSDQFNI